MRAAAETDNTQLLQQKEVCTAVLHSECLRPKTGDFCISNIVQQKQT